MYKSVIVTSLIMGSVITLSGCSLSASSQAELPSSACLEAFNKASEGIENLYATHPLYGAESDAIYADGVVTDEEQAQINVWLDDSDAQYAAIIAPTYEQCQGVEDFYAGAYAQGDKGDWNVRGNEVISDSESRDIFLNSYCHNEESKPACSDFVPEK